MKLYQNTMGGLRYRGWTRSEAALYFLKGVARELHIAPDFFQNFYDAKRNKIFKSKWLKQNGDEAYFDFGICKFPDVSTSKEKFSFLTRCFEDVLMFPCILNDNYRKDVVEHYDRHMQEGPYGYTDGSFDVTVKKGDVVIDAGAWIGAFSAYAASKGATAYAFEPVAETFQWLRKTQKLNSDSVGQIYPIQKGLSSSKGEAVISIAHNHSAVNSMVIVEGAASETVAITTLDEFVEENKLKRVDFIKADIEGMEREMLRGAANVLKTFAPKLAICTYHFPDDPEVLEKIIKEANPAYKVVHLSHKLFAAVVK